MAKTKQQKKEMLADIKEKIDKSKSMVFTSFDSLGVKENEELRNKLKAEQSEYLVVKKTLLDIALKEKKIKGVDAKELEGKLAVVFGYEDEVAPAKIIAAFIKEYDEKIKFIGGFLENKYLDEDEINALSKLPSKQELYAKIVGSINAPVSGFVNVLAGNLRKLVYVIKAIEEKTSAR
ncbi:50S ribosomal protein L10 [bacterium]|nr:50S ribosomal protein L10 [bacterium]